MIKKRKKIQTKTLKNITKKVQAYFKHLCALIKNLKQNDMSVYNQNLPYSIFLWRKISYRYSAIIC